MKMLATKKMFRLRIYLSIIILVLVVASTGAYYWFIRAPEKPLQSMTLRVGHLLADELHQPGWCVAKEMGYFMDEGFEVVHSEYIHGPEEMEHFAAGELDVAYVGAAPFLTARAGGVNIIAVASSNIEGSSIVVAKEIKEVMDLNGKNIGSPGIGTIQDYMLSRIEEKYRIRFTHFYATVTDLIIYFQKGEIDGYIAWEPHATRAVVEGVRSAYALLTSHEILPGHQCCVLAVRGDWVREATYIVRRIVRWHMKVHRWVLEHPIDAETTIAKYSGLPVDLVKAAYTIVKHPYPPYVDLPSCKIMTEGLITTGKIKSEKVPNIGEFIKESIDNSFVEDLNEELRPPMLQSSYKIAMALLKLEISTYVLIFKSVKKFPRE